MVEHRRGDIHLQLDAGKKGTSVNNGLVHGEWLQPSCSHPYLDLLKNKVTFLSKAFYYCARNESIIQVQSAIKRKELIHLEVVNR